MRSLVANRYELGGLLGSGGAAEVFEALDRRLGRRVAVKFLRGDLLDARARARFDREALVAAQLVHPHAVRVYDLGTDAGRPFLVMEYVAGATLADRLARDGPLTATDAIRIADEILSALAAAHEVGLVHRDVKPANVLIASDGTAKLADFGVAKAMADATNDVTATGQVVGTPKYLSPEQAAGQAATPRSDLYAVGIILYEMLAGEPPFDGGPIQLAVAHQQAPVPSLLTRRPDLSSRLAAVVERALAKDPARRFPDATAMRAALAQASAPALPDTESDLTAVAPVASAPDRATRAPTRRRPWLLVAAAVVVVLVVVLALLPGGAPSTSARRTTTPPRARATPSTAPSTVPSTDTTVPTTNPTPAPTAAQPAPTVVNVPALISMLEANPTAFGTAGPELLRRLQQVQANPDRASTRATNTIRAVQAWVARQRLDPTIGAVVVTLLTPIAATPSAPSSGDGGGGSRGGGGD